MSNTEDSSPTEKFGALSLLVKNPLSQEPDDVDEKITKTDDEQEDNKFDHNKENFSTPAIDGITSSKRNQTPRRSISDSTLTNHETTAKLLTAVPIQKDESSTDDEDTYGAQIKSTNATFDINESHDQYGQNSTIQEELNTTNDTFKDKSFNLQVQNNNRPSSAVRKTFSTESQNRSPSRKQSASSKRSLSTTGHGNDEKHDHKMTDRIPSARKPSQFSSAHSSKIANNLIKSGEQLSIPLTDIENGRIHSPPPTLPSGVKKTNSRPSSSTRSLTTKENFLDNDNHLLSGNRRTSSRSQQDNSIDTQTNVEMKRKGSQSSDTSGRRKNISNQMKPHTQQDDGSSETTGFAEQSKLSSGHRSQQKITKSPGKPSSRKSSKQDLTIEMNKTYNHRSSTDTDVSIQESTKNLSRKNSKRSIKCSITNDSDYENKTKLTSSTRKPKINSTDAKQSSSWIQKVHISPLDLTDDDKPPTRPQSPNVEQIARRNSIVLPTNQRVKAAKRSKEQHQQIRRSNSAESFNYIPVVDDKSLDSTSGNNTETEQHTQRRIKSKTKDVQTETEAQTYARTASVNETNHRKSSKTLKPNSDKDIDSKRVISNKSKKTLQDLLLNTDDRNVQSDTEQILTEKQKKRRRPKRISRTSQTYECVFRRMELDQHEELLPINDNEKTIQTRQSYLRPQINLLKRKKTNYLSAESFKVEEIPSKPFIKSQRNLTKSVTTTRNLSRDGKLLIVQPKLPFHHTDAVRVQRIYLQYSIDLVPNETPLEILDKQQPLKFSPQPHSLPMISSSATSTDVSACNNKKNKSNNKERTNLNKSHDQRAFQKRTSGAF